METLVLPPEDELARRHYWHTGASKMKGFLPPMLAPPPSRGRLIATTLFNPLDRNLDSKELSSERKNLVREDVYLSDRSRNRPADPVCRASFSAVASSVTRSAGSLSSAPFHRGLESVGGSENELSQPTLRLTASPDIAPLVGRTSGGLRMVRSLPEKAAMKLSNAPAMELFEKKRHKEKKSSYRKVAERAVHQREALENIPTEVKILRRSETTDRVRSKNILLSDLREDYCAWKAGKAENLSGRGFPRLTRRNSSSDKASSLPGDLNLAEAADEDAQSSSSESLTSKLYDFAPIRGFSKPFWAGELTAEKWAGPCYTISPPPSSLPFPKFGLQRQGGSVGIAADSSPKSNHFQIDTEIATKNLRRILHLDFA